MRIPVRDVQVGAWGRAEDGCEKRCSGGLSTENGSPLMPARQSPQCQRRRWCLSPRAGSGMRAQAQRSIPPKETCSAQLRADR